MTVLASGSKGNATVVAAGATRILVDAGLSCRELLRRMAAAGEDAEALTAILITHEHVDHVAGLAVLARRLRVPVFFTEPTHRAWARSLTPKTTMSYSKWLELREHESRRAGASGEATSHPSQAQDRDAGHPMHAPAHTFAAVAELEAEPGPAEPDAQPTNHQQPATNNQTDPTYLPAVEYFRAGQAFSIGEIEVHPFTIPHDAADPCGFVFHARPESIRMAIATDLGYIPPNVKQALRDVDVLLLESNHDLEMLKDGPYPWSVKQRVLSRVGHLSNAAAAEFLLRDYDGGAHTIVLGHLSEQNNLPELARLAAEQAIGDRMSLLGNRVVLARQDAPLEPICL
jgi:phosphoribosyl 1,2-cyclic phosphodiesterase